MNIKKHLEMNQLDSSFGFMRGGGGVAGCQRWQSRVSCLHRAAPRRAAAGASPILAPAHHSYPGAASGLQSSRGMGGTALVPPHSRTPIAPRGLILQALCLAARDAAPRPAVRLGAVLLTSRKTRCNAGGEIWGPRPRELRGKGFSCESLACGAEPQRAAGIALQPPQEKPCWADVPTRNTKQSPETGFLLLYQGSKVPRPASRTLDTGSVSLPSQKHPAFGCRQAQPPRCSSRGHAMGTASCFTVDRHRQPTGHADGSGLLSRCSPSTQEQPTVLSARELRHARSLCSSTPPEHLKSNPLITVSISSSKAHRLQNIRSFFFSEQAN